MADYIRREDYCEENCGKENREGYKTCRNCGMLNVPSADVRPVKHGRWITAHPVDVAKEFKCTACGGLIELPVFAKRCYYDYCPNCGARMGLKDGEKHA